MNHRIQQSWERSWYHFKTNGRRHAFKPPLLVAHGGRLFRLHSFTVHGRYSPAPLTSEQQAMREKMQSKSPAGWLWDIPWHEKPTHWAKVTHVTATMHHTDFYGTRTTVNLKFWRDKEGG